MSFQAIANDGRPDRICVRTRCDAYQEFLLEAERQRHACQLMGWTPHSYNEHRDQFWVAVVNLRAVRTKRDSYHYAVARALAARDVFDDYPSYCAGAESGMCGEKELDRAKMEEIYRTDYDYGEDPIPISEAEWNLSYQEHLVQYARSTAEEAHWMNKCDAVGGTRLWRGGRKPPDYITDEALERHKRNYEEKTRELAYEISQQRPENTPEENWKCAEWATLW